MNTKIVALIVGVVILLGGAYFLRTQQPADSAITQGDAQDGLVVYSGRKEALILPIIQSFEKETGIKVTTKFGSTEELANLILQEKDQTQADVYIGTDASLLEMLSAADLFTPIESEKIASIPAAYRADDNTWTGVSGRARVLMVNTDMVSEDQYPDSIYDITDEVWKGKVAMAQMANESVVTHLSAIRTLRGDEFVQDFLQGIQANEVTLLGGHTDVRQAVARGEFPIGFVNHYYAHLQQQESDNIAIVYTDQSETMDGTVVNVSGAGIVTHGDNQEAAQAFIDYLLSTAAQKQFAELNFEFPLTEGVQTENTKNLGEFKQMNVDLHEVATKREGTIELLKAQGF